MIVGGILYLRPLTSLSINSVKDPIAYHVLDEISWYNNTMVEAEQATFNFIVDQHNLMRCTKNDNPKINIPIAPKHLRYLYLWMFFTNTNNTNDEFSIDDDTEQIKQKRTNQINIILEHSQIGPFIIISP